MQSIAVDLPRTKIVDVEFDLLSYEEVFSAILNWRSAGRRSYVCLSNPHSVMLCRRDPDMKSATVGAGLVLPDGVGILMAARILGLANSGRVTGPALMLQLCDWGRSVGLRHYLLGGGDGIAGQLANQLTSMYPGLRVVGTYAPPFRSLDATEDSELVQKINSASPDVLWVGLGAPKQEKWMASHLGQIQATTMIGVGAAFDFHSGNVPWAPAWMRRTGLEWLHRLLQNPRRMWRRNLDSFTFLSQVFAQKFGLRP